jgi:hypothetical protein
VAVETVPGVGHLGITIEPRALKAVTRRLHVIAGAMTSCPLAGI